MFTATEFRPRTLKQNSELIILTLQLACPHIIRNIGIPFATEHKFNNLNELYEYIHNIDIRNTQGIIVANQITQSNIKLVNDMYKSYYGLRGNTPSVKFRYLEIRLDTNLKNGLYELYPEHVKDFEEYENILFMYAQNILQAYIQRYINKNYVSVTSDQFKIMGKCHEWHKLNKETNKINLNKVISILNEQTAVYLNRMIKDYKNENNLPTQIN